MPFVSGSGHAGSKQREHAECRNCGLADAVGTRLAAGAACVILWRVANFSRGGKVAPAMTTVLDDAYSAVVGEYQMTRRVSWRWQWH